MDLSGRRQVAGETRKIEEVVDGNDDEDEKEDKDDDAVVKKRPVSRETIWGERDDIEEDE